MFSHARSLIAAETPGDAYSLLEPHLTDGATWRRRWVLLVEAALDGRSRIVRWLDAVTEAMPEDGSWRVCLSIAQAWAKVPETVERANLWERAVDLATRIEPSAEIPSSALFQVGFVLQYAGRPEPAVRFYRRALDGDPDHAMAHNNLAMVLANHYPDRLGKAWEHAKRAADLRPKPPMLDTLAYVQSEMGNHSAAKRAIDRAIDREPENPKWRVRRAEILAASGAEERAARVLKHLPATAGTDKLPKSLRGRVRTLRTKLN